MGTAQKLRTAAKLAVRGEFGLLRRQWKIFQSENLLRQHGTSPFVYRRHGFRAVCHPDWQDSVGRLRDVTTDTLEIATLRAWLQPGDAAWDIGANLGMYTFAAADRVGPKGRVLALDADPTIVERLTRAAMMLNASQIKVLHAAIADEAGELTFHVRRDRASTGVQSLRPTAEQRAESVPISVRARTLSEVAASEGDSRRVAAVKMDIEGAEDLACRGAPAAWFATDGPLWIFELNPAALQQFETTPRVLLSRFPEAAFERWLLPQHPRDSKLAGMPQPLTDHREFDDALYYNVIAVPRGAAALNRRRRLSKWLRVSR